MMGRLEQDQAQLFYSFCLEEVVPDDHQVRAIASVLDLSWVYGELSPHALTVLGRQRSEIGHPSARAVLEILAGIRSGCSRLLDETTNGFSRQFCARRERPNRCRSAK